MSTLDPSVIDHEIAFREVEQDPEERLIGVLVRGFQLVAASLGGDGEIKWEDLDPPFGKHSQKKTQADEYVTPDQQVAMLGAQIHGNRSG